MEPLGDVRRTLYFIGANIIFLVHLLLVLIVTFGWLVGSLYYLFLASVVATFLSEATLGFCVLTKLEFGIRKKLHPEQIFPHSCITYYGRALFRLKPADPSHKPGTFFQKYSFLGLMIILSVVGTLFHFFI